jgi:hypothetical protein
LFIFSSNSVSILIGGHGRKAVIDAWIQAGGSIEARGSGGLTPLIASVKRHVSGHVYHYLLRQTASPLPRDHYGRDAIMTILRLHPRYEDGETTFFAEAINHLLEYGGQSPPTLIWWLLYRMTQLIATDRRSGITQVHSSVMDRLLSAGSDVNLRQRLPPIDYHLWKQMDGYMNDDIKEDDCATKKYYGQPWYVYQGSRAMFRHLNSSHESHTHTTWICDPPMGNLMDIHQLSPLHLTDHHPYDQQHHNGVADQPSSKSEAELSLLVLGATSKLTREEREPLEQDDQFRDLKYITRVQALSTLQTFGEKTLTLLSNDRTIWGMTPLQYVVKFVGGQTYGSPCLVCSIPIFAMSVSFSHVMVGNEQISWVTRVVTGLLSHGANPNDLLWCLQDGLVRKYMMVQTFQKVSGCLDHSIYPSYSYFGCVWG